MTPSILTAAQEGLRLAEKATKGPWIELPGPYSAGIKSELGTLICGLGPTATSMEFLANRALIAHCGTHHADICRWALELAERLAAIELAAIESAAKAEDFNKRQAENAELKRQLEEAVKRAADCPNCAKLKSELDNATAARESAWATVADEREKREQLLDKYYDLERQLKKANQNQAMTETEPRVQLAKKLGWRYHAPKPPWVGYWVNPIGNPTELLSLYDLCLDGEERLTEEQQQRKYIEKLCSDVYIACLCEHGAYWPELFAAIRLSNLPERAKALCEVLP